MDDFNHYCEQGDRLIDEARRFRGATYKGLCFRCERSFIRRADGQPDPIIDCMMMEEGVRSRQPTNIVECNRFKAIGTVDVWQLAKLAKIIDVEEPKKAGFTKHDR